LHDEEAYKKENRKVKNTVPPENEKMLEKKLKNIEKQRTAMIKKLKGYEKSLKNNPSFGYNNVAFVTLNSEKIKDDYLEAAKKETRSYCSTINLWFQRMFCSSKIPFKITRAPEPDDIKWTNIGFSEKSRKKTLLYSSMIMNIVLFVSLIAQFYIKVVEKRIVRNYKDSEVWFHKRGIQALNVVAAILITVINSILTKLATNLSEYELHISKTGFYTSHTKAIVKAQIINTGFVTFLLYYLP
jgi:hypothetical protein